MTLLWLFWNYQKKKTKNKTQGIVKVTKGLSKQSKAFYLQIKKLCSPLLKYFHVHV